MQRCPSICCAPCTTVTVASLVCPVIRKVYDAVVDVIVATGMCLGGHLVSNMAYIVCILLMSDALHRLSG